MIRFPHTRWPVRRWPQNRWPDNAARYEVRKRTTIDGADTVIAVLAPGSTQFFITAVPDTLAWYWVRGFNRCGVADSGAHGSRLQRVEFDSGGTLVAPVPNPPTGLRLKLGAAGQVTAEWGYSSHLEAAKVAQFNVYVATDANPFNYTTPTHTVTTVGRRMSRDLGAFADTTLVKVVVRSQASGGAEESNTDQVSINADAAAPAAPSAGRLEVNP